MGYIDMAKELWTYTLDDLESMDIFQLEDLLERAKSGYGEVWDRTVYGYSSAYTDSAEDMCLANNEAGIAKASAKATVEGFQGEYKDVDTIWNRIKQTHGFCKAIGMTLGEAIGLDETVKEVARNRLNELNNFFESTASNQTKGVFKKARNGKTMSSQGNRINKTIMNAWIKKHPLPPSRVIREAKERMARAVNRNRNKSLLAMAKEGVQARNRAFLGRPLNGDAGTASNMKALLNAGLPRGGRRTRRGRKGRKTTRKVRR